MHLVRVRGLSQVVVLRGTPRAETLMITEVLELSVYMLSQKSNVETAT